MLRVVVDAKVWVSALLNRYGSPARVQAALAEQRFTLVVSEPLLNELAEVLARPRLQRKFPPILNADGIAVVSVRRFLDLLARNG